jgi:YggT family protein
MIILGPLINVIYDLLGLYKLALFIFIVMSWLEAFNIVNRYNGFVYGLHNFLRSIIEPSLERIRRFIPSVSGWDLSPIALVFIIYFIQGVLLEILKRFPS